MELVLKITSYHRLSPEIETTKTTQSSLTFGRSQNCDWHLPDPEKIISSHHGKITYENGKYFVHDDSTNGIFINFNVSQIGAGNKHVLNNGDVLSIGDFQIEASLDQPVNIDSNAPTQIVQNIESVSMPSEALNTEFNDLLQPRENQYTSNTNLNEYMEAPKFSAVQDNPTIQVQPTMQIPEDWDDLATLDANQPAIQTEINKITPAEIKPQKVQITSAVQQDGETLTAVTAQPKNQKTNIDNNDLIQAFLNGLDINNDLAVTLNTEQLWFDMGKSLNLLLNGVMDILRQRTAIKNQLKLNHTMFQTEQNNPLKFSATTEDVVQSLFLRKSNSFLSFEESIKEVFIDTKNHEKALVSGALGAVEGVLEQLSPDAIKQQAFEHSSLGKFIPGQVDAKSWGLFLQLHSELSEKISSKGNMALSDDFLKAYEKNQ